MSRRLLLLAGAALAVLTAVTCLRIGLWERPMRMDNRFYFYIAERAASGIPPHVSAPDVKTQLSTLVDAEAIRIGRMVGLDDVRAGRVEALIALIAGLWGTGVAVFELGATAGAAFLGAMSVLAFSALASHTAIGFNPKILQFSILAWLPVLVARGRFLAAGGAATAAMLCWQPAVGACVATAVAALTTGRRWRALGSVLAGGAAVFLAYEGWFAFHGALDPQIFQSYVLPLGSVHEAVNWMDGARFVIFGEEHAADRYGLPAASFALLLLGTLGTLLRAPVPGPGREAAPVAPLVVVLVGGLFTIWFTAYDHQAEPDRFILCSYFATAFGVVIDRLAHALRSRVGEGASLRLEGLMAGLLLLAASRGDFEEWKQSDTLQKQMETAHLVAMYSEAYGSVWAWGCTHLLGLAHLTNHHPYEHTWDDIDRYVDKTSFTPIAHGQLPDLILKRGQIPGKSRLLAQYVEVPLPALAADNAELYVRRDLRDATFATPATAVRRKPNADRRRRRLGYPPAGF